MIRWAVNNPVAVNLLMVAIIVAGLLVGLNTRQELFPSSDPSQVSVSTIYEGATPEEIERTITSKVEEAVQDVSGIKEILSTSSEGRSSVTIECETDVDPDDVASDVRRIVEGLTTLPVDAEDPVIAEVDPKFPVITLMVRLEGDDEYSLRRVSRDIKDELIRLGSDPFPGEERKGLEKLREMFFPTSPVSDVTVTGIKEPEISIEFTTDKLERFGLVAEDLRRAIANANRDRPGGTLELSGGKIRVRTLGERDQVNRYNAIPLRTLEDGTSLLLGDVARVSEGFKDVESGALFQGNRAASLTVFKSPEDNAVRISDRVQEYVEWKNASGTLPEGVVLETTADLADFIRQRRELLTKNALQGLALVLIVLVLFLNVRVAFWVAAGLPISLMGTLVVMQVSGASINLISLFGMLIVVGLIVDDGIVIGENIWKRIERGDRPHVAAVRGGREVTMPILAAVTTTIVAFMPLAFMPGRIGTFLGDLPVIVAAALAVSTIECFLILPSHLAEWAPKKFRRDKSKPAVEASSSASERLAAVVSSGNQALKGMTGVYSRFLSVCIRWKYVTIAAMIGFAVMCAGLLAGGFIRLVFLQESDSDRITVSLEMTSGTPGEETRSELQRIDQGIREIPEVRTSYVLWGGRVLRETGTAGAAAEETGQIIVELVPAENREVSSKTIVAQIRELAGDVPGANVFTVAGNQGGPGGKDIECRIASDNQAQRQRAVEVARDLLLSYPAVKDLEDTLRLGQPEIQLRLKPRASVLGLNEANLAQQVRNAFFGAKVQTVQRGPDDVEVYVRRDKADRTRFADVDRMQIRTPRGELVPLIDVAELVSGRGYSAINRVDLQRTETVSAAVDQAIESPDKIQAGFIEAFQEAIDDEGLNVSFELVGRKQQSSESLGSLAKTFPIALLGIFAILALLFRSYLQPLIVMSAIPFGFVGAVVGHWIMNSDYTLLSWIGIIALAGIVVNDSSILVDFINRRVRAGMPLVDAVISGCRERLRPILLTTITTSAGLAPLMLEKSFQASFLVPMAISIVFGIIFATALTLIMIPCAYVAVYQFVNWLRAALGMRPLHDAHHFVSAEDALVEVDHDA